jgi:hypothetical protein
VCARRPLWSDPPACALQKLGFTLEAVDAMDAHYTGAATCDSELWRLEAVVDQVDAKLAVLRRTTAKLHNDRGVSGRPMPARTDA